MINPEAKLVPNIFESDIISKPPRDGFGEGLVLAGEYNEKIVALCADLTDSVRMKMFKERFPNRFFQIGIAEQNMAAVAAGLAAAGKIPFIASYAMFSPGRNWEQIRTTACYNDQPVKIAGAHAGVSVGPDGATHQALEDIAIMRVLPNILVEVPCDSLQTQKTTLASVEINKPFYFRFGREKTPLFTTEDTPFEIGKADIYWLPKPEAKKENTVMIVAAGPLVYNALLAAKELEAEGIDTYVINNHTIKPMDQKTLINVAKRCCGVVTVEEHQKMGGMGSAVSEILSQHHPIKMEFIGISDRFGETGSPDELMAYFGLEAVDIKEAVLKIIKL
ncbi:MAG: transketolase family protein [Candidatus Parcubacteria bacterium]|nr:transketolase family protein [Candidatus Parcubacteria bacterium]